MNEKMTLLAGAGKAFIDFPEEAFPTYREDYVGVHDLPHARVLILEDTQRFVIVNLEIVNIFPDTREKLVEILYEETGVQPENIWFHNAHVLSTPHAWKVHFDPSKRPKDVPGGPGGMKPRTSQQQKSVELVSEAICRAVRTAASMAAKNMRPAKVGSGQGYCLGNVNRNLETHEGWWVSCNDEGPADHHIPILRVDDMSGEPIAILFGFHAQPAVLDMVFLEGGGRLVSGDIAGYSTEFIEDEYPGAVAMYFTGAGGDGSPIFRGDYFLVGRNGRRINKNIHEKAYLLAELLGERIGQQVVMAADRIRTDALCTRIHIKEIKCGLPAKKRADGPPARPDGPVRTMDLSADGTIDIPISAMCIGDMGFVGLIPEIGQTTEIYIKEHSPFKTTMVSTFTNSGPKESGLGKYLGEAQYYDKVTFQAINSLFAKGAAEIAAETAIALLKDCVGEECFYEKD